MLRQRSEQIRLLVGMVDVLTTLLAFFGAFWVREWGLPASAPRLAQLEQFEWILAISVAAHMVIYPYFGFYGSLRLKSAKELILMAVRALLLETLVLGTLVFVLQAKATSRLFFVTFLLLNYGMVLAVRIGARMTLASVRGRGYNFRRVLICGMGPNAMAVVDTLRGNKHWGYLPVGFLGAPTDDGSAREHVGLPVLGTVRDLSAVIRRLPVDEVYFAFDTVSHDEISEEIFLCEKLGIPARLSLGGSHLLHSRISFSMLGPVPVVSFYTTAMTPAEAFLKRVIDILVSIVGLALTAALYPWIAYRIKKESPGPVIFKQQRVGENGRRFKCYKFRTMGTDAEAKKTALLAKNEMQGPIFKINNDPRVFPFGQFLRKTSLDELPQFLNIIRGEMSVVGVRPPTPDEVDRYEIQFRRRLSIRPGLTGLWQVSGRSNIRKFEEIVALDLQYIDQWSIWMDLRIILKTIWVALFRRGAT